MAFQYNVGQHFLVTVIYHYKPTKRHKTRVRRATAAVYGYGCAEKYEEARRLAEENAAEKYTSQFVKDQVAFADVSVGYMDSVYPLTNEEWD